MNSKSLALDTLPWSPDHAPACAAAGFTLVKDWTTLDPSEYFAPGADAFEKQDLAAAESALLEDGVFENADWTREYLEREWPLRFTPETLARVAVKFGWALAYAAECGGAEAIRFDALHAPTTPLEHLFIALELRRRAVPFTALALSWPGAFEPAIDYTGDVEVCARALAEHAAIARDAGGHQLSFPHAEEKFALLPLIGRECAHVHLAGLDWLEALRVAAQTTPELLHSILAAAQEHFVFDRIGQVLSTAEEDVRFLPHVPHDQLEGTFLDDPRGRQLLQVTAPSILAKPSLTEPLRAMIAAHEARFHALAEARLQRHLRALTRGETGT